MIVNKYLAGFIAVALVALTAFQAALVDGFTVTEGWQLAGLVVGAFVTTFVPITPGKWAASLKVLGAILGAAIAAIVPFVTQGWNTSAVVVVILAVINALAVQLGVNARVDAARVVIADPNIPNQAIQAVDPKAVEAAAASPKQRMV